MKWYEIVEPHKDIKRGGFDESIFAADLADVASKTAPDDYNDPYLFFKKTYLTAGLKKLLQDVYQKLSTGEGQAVLELKTRFGGGKTHSLVTIYHYLKNGDKVKEFLPKRIAVINSKVFVCVGTHLNPLSDKRKFKTLWGMLGQQLAGEEGYNVFAKNDQKLVSPGKDELRSFLKQHQPFILLFDEVLEYINRAVGVEKGKNNLGVQTFSFFQELTEAVASLDKGMLFATLPSSTLEDYGEEQHNYLVRLDNIFSRVARPTTPIQGEEIYSIINRRLFSQEINENRKKEVINKYFELYQKEKESLPIEVRQSDYKRKLELSYPFHPSIIDILYYKWSTFSDFQRTRGMLRLLASVLKDLYDREEDIDFILPGDVNLNVSSVREEFLRLIGSQYEGVVDGDIADHQAKAQMLDKEHKAWKHLAERTATAIFFSSFSADKEDKGITLPYIKLSVLRKDTIPSLVTEVLDNEMLKTLWYLEKKDDKYYFSDTPTLNKVIRDKRDAFQENELKEEFKNILQTYLGTEVETYLWPTISDNIPDNKELKIVILEQDITDNKIKEFVQKKGASDRIYKNTLIFILPDSVSYNGMLKDIRNYLALKEIESEVNSGKRNELKDQLGEIRDRKNKLEQNFSYQLRNIYKHIKIGNREINLGQPTIGRQTLTNWLITQLENEDEIIVQLSPQTIVSKFLAENEQVSTQQILDQFYKDPQMPIIKERSVIEKALQKGLADKIFGLVQLSNEGNIISDSLKFGDRDLPPDTFFFDSNELIMSPANVEKILQNAGVGEEVVTEQQPEAGDDELKDKDQREKITPVSEDEKQYKNVKLKIKNIPHSKIADFNRGVLNLLASKVGDISFGVEIDLHELEVTLPESTLKKIRESLEEIGAEIEEEIEE